MAKLTIRIDDVIHKKLVEYLDREGKTQNSFIVSLIEQALSEGKTLDERVSEIEQRLSVLEAQQKK